MEELSIHDNIVTGYTVSCEKREIIMHTVFREIEPNEFTDVILKGVEAYQIAGDNMATILFDFEECPIEQLLKDFQNEFENGVRYSWPGPWNTSPQACLEHFVKKGCKGWTINSSYGMYGFVIADSIELRPIKTGQPST